MAENPTLWDQFQNLMYNTWWGVALLAIAAAIPVLAGLAKLVKESHEATQVIMPPRVDLKIQSLRIENLDLYPDINVDGQNPVFPIGAVVSFDLRHSARSEGQIRINGIIVRLVEHDGAAACPFTLTGDRQQGAGDDLARMFRVALLKSGVSAVEYEKIKKKIDSNGKEVEEKLIYKGNSENILALEQSHKLTLQGIQADSMESVEIETRALDPGMYKLSLFIRYNTPDGDVEQRDVTSLRICSP